MKKKIAVFTGTRAEYGLLRPVVKKMLCSEKLEPVLYVTGAHLSEKLGYTISEIEADNMPVAAKIDILKFGHGQLATAQSVGYATGEFAKLLQEQKPDAIMLLGDRYEAFAAASAAAMLEIPIFHISGGDVTLGAADEFFRHCITKMARLHFPSCRSSAKRVIQLGESPDTVHCVGGLGDENLRNMDYLSLEKLSESLGVDLSQQYLLVTYHPETAGGTSPSEQMGELLNALSQFPHTVIFTKANADSGGALINEMLDEYCASHARAHAFTSLGSLRYLSAMKNALAVVGNSSSGVVETPTLGIPCVNIGSRQKGRLITQNVICCKPDGQSIYAAIAKACTKAFREIAKKTLSPYNGGNTSAKIVSECEKFLFSPKSCTVKAFYDINFKDENQ